MEQFQINLLKQLSQLTPAQISQLTPAQIAQIKELTHFAQLAQKTTATAESKKIINNNSKM